jgi:Winged helix DNA-binding domain
VRTIGLEERRARLALRHHLDPQSRSEDFVSLAGDLVGLHATDPATVYLAARARMDDAPVAHVERVLYDERRALRMLGMRRTMFVLPLDLAPVVQAACTDAIAVKQRQQYAQLLEQAGIAADGAGWLDEVCDETLAVLYGRGEAFATELSADVPDLRKKISYGEGKTWAGSQGMTSIVLFLLAAHGRIVRGRPKGSWTSSQHRWAPAETWLPEPLPRIDAETARMELFRRWLRAYGPGTVNDLKWWSGLTVGQVKAALPELKPVEVDLDGATGFVLSGDDEPVAAPEPWAALLPALDPTVMGWKERAWYLGEHGPALFDTAGNAGPTVWWNGRIVGGWAVRKGGEVVYRLLEDVGSEAVAAIDAETARLAEWLGETNVVPRFGTPLARELAA